MKIKGLDSDSVDALVLAYEKHVRVAIVKAITASNTALTSKVLVAAGGTAVDPHAGYDAITVISTVWDQEVNGTLHPELAAIMLNSAHTVARQFAKSQEITVKLPDVDAEMAKALLSDSYADHVLTTSLGHVRAFSTELATKVHSIINMGVYDGFSVDEIAQDVHDIGALNMHKAKTIAQTAVIAAVNGGEWAQMIKLASAFDMVATKTWEATEDSHTRPTHHAADGQTRPLTTTFEVGDALLQYPGDPVGPPGEIVNCRCTTLFDLDDKPSNASLQTSSDAQTAAAPAVTTGPSEVIEPFLLAAVNAEFNAMHPRGKDGKFITKGTGLPAHALQLLTNLRSGTKYDDFLTPEKDAFVHSISQITPEQWHNLKTEDQSSIQGFVDAAMHEGIPGSGHASLHIDDLNDSADVVHNISPSEEVFQPATKLPASSITSPIGTASDAWHHTDITGDPMYHTSGGYMIALKSGQIRLFKRKTNGEWDTGKPVEEGQIPLGTWTSQEVPHKKPLKPLSLPKKAAKKAMGGGWMAGGKQPVQHAPQAEKKVEEIKPTHVSTPFEILADMGDNGDGYAAPGLWGKYGAAGVMIAAPGSDGETRFLVVQRGPMVSSNKDKWQLAGGALNSKETPEQGAAREIFEEIGAPQEYLATMKKVGSHDIEVPIPGKKPWKYSNIVAEAPTTFDPKIDGTETGDAKWLTEDEIKQLAADGKLHPALAKNLDQVFAVYHTGKSDVSMGTKKAEGDVAELTPSVSAPEVPQTTIAKATPIKMTHGLIHAKHTPGETIAQAKVPAGYMRVTWNGKEYEVTIGKTAGPGGAKTNVVKSKLYAYLAKNFPNAQWHAPGKQDVDVNAPSVSKAVTGKPLFPGSSIDDKLDQAFGVPAVSAPSVQPSAPESKPLTKPNAAQTYDLTGWKEVGGQGGSNKGGLYEAPDGQRYYVKSLKSEDHVKNEVLAAALYNAAGVKVPEVRAGANHPDGWSNVLVSPIIDGSGASSKLQGDDAFKAKVQDGFAVDAWLANWDTVGLTFDNVKDVNGEPVRIDVGGSLLYRAQGGPKGSKFGDTVGELDTLKNPGLNPQSAKVFGGMSTDDERNSAKHLLGVTDDQIDQLTKDAGMPQSLADTIKARRKFILDKYGLGTSTVDTPTSDDPLAEWEKLTGKPANVNIATPAHEPDVNAPSMTYATVDTPAQWKAVVDGAIDGTVVAHTDDGHVLTYKHDPPWVGGQPDMFTLKDSTGKPIASYADYDVEQGNVAVDYPDLTFHVGQPPADVAKPKTTMGPVDWSRFAEQLASQTGDENGVVAKSLDGQWSLKKDPTLNDDFYDLHEHTSDGGSLWIGTWHKSAIENGDLAKGTSSEWELTGVKKAAPPSVTSVSHEDIITNWQGVVTKDHQPHEVIAESTDGKYFITKNSFGGYALHKKNDAGGADLISGSYLGSDLVNGDHLTYAHEWAVPSAKLNVDAKPPLGSVVDVTPNTSHTMGITHLSYSQKSTFYNHFKNEKVSPSWSGAKIYNSLQVAKQKMQSDPAMAQLSDDQLLELVDQKLKSLAPYGKYSSDATPYRDKVKAWLKTPSGKKAALAAKQHGWASGSATVKKTGSTKTAAHSIGPIDVGPATAASVKHDLTDAELDDIYTKVKNSSTGNSVKSPPAELFNTVHKIAKEKGVTDSVVLSAMDVKTQEKYGKVSHTYSETIKNWLGTPSGKKTGNEILAGTWTPPKPKSYSSSTYGSSYGGNFTHDAHVPLFEKVPDVSGTVPSHSASKPQSDFKVISTSAAHKMWNDMQSQHGVVAGGQKSSLKYYTTNAGFAAMNKYLRGQQGATDATVKHVKNAQEGMRPSTQDIVLHRGSGWFVGFESVAAAKAQQGKTFRQDGFFSASVGGNAAFGGSIKFEIEAPAGTPMAYLVGNSHYNGENEMLLAAGLTFHVVSVEDTGKGYYGGVKIRLRVVSANAGSSELEVE